MKAKLCSESQRWTFWFTSNTGPVCSVLPGTGACSLSRQDYCVSLSATVLLRASKCFCCDRGVDTGWHAAQSKDPFVVLQGDYAASDALPIALWRPYALASGWDGEIRHKKHERPGKWREQGVDVCREWCQRGFNGQGGRFACSTLDRFGSENRKCQVRLRP